jgi:hypothetical protein
MMDEEELSDTLFWAELHGVKDVEIKTIREWIECDGYAIDPHPSDETLNAALMALIDHLASVGVFLTSTDHMSDRELYDFLVQGDLLRAHRALLPDSFVCCDVISGGSAEDHAIYLRYYASEDDRARWARDFPEDEMPPREKPPYDRDRFLP